MTSFQKPKAWNIKPDMTAAPSLWRRCTAILPVWGEGWYDPLRREYLSTEASPEQVLGRKGSALRTNVTAGEGVYYDDASWAPEDEVSVIVRKRRRDGTDRQNSAFGIGDSASGSGTARLRAHLPWSDGTVYWDFGGTGTGQRLTYSSGTFGDDTWGFGAGPSGLQIWQNGFLRASASTASPSRTNASGQQFGFGNSWDGEVGGGDNNGDNADLDLLIVFSRQISGPEFELLTGRDPFIMLRPAGF